MFLQGFIRAFSLSTIFVLKIQFYERGSIASKRVVNSLGSGGAVSPLGGGLGNFAFF